LCLYLPVMYVSFGNKYLDLGFLIESTTLCLWVGELRSLAFRVMIQM
jgi:hypothetical protein